MNNFELNKLIVSEPPARSFQGIDRDRLGWEDDFLSTVKKRHAIKYDAGEMGDIPEEIMGELSRNGYWELVLASDHDQRFLVPEVEFYVVKFRRHWSTETYVVKEAFLTSGEAAHFALKVKEINGWNRTDTEVAEVYIRVKGTK